jgi:dsRNA-specific ribonuclease
VIEASVKGQPATVAEGNSKRAAEKTAAAQLLLQVQKVQKPTKAQKTT